MARFEWILIEIVVLAILVCQLYAVRREIRRRKAAQQTPHVGRPDPKA
jgi:hypothetical protein